MLLQDFIQFFAALIITNIKFPHKFRSIKRIVPTTFIFLRLGVFILVTQFKKVCGYIRSVTNGELGLKFLIKKMEVGMKLVSLMKKMGSGMGLKNMGIGESRFLKSIREFF